MKNPHPLNINAIKRTLCYSTLFNYPMSFFQIGTYLISGKRTKERYLKQDLNRLAKDGWAKKRYGKYGIKSEKYSDWQSKQEITKKLINKNLKFLKFIGSVPWIKMMSITGSVSFYNSDKNSDIDIFIITEKNRVWITRGFVTLLTKILDKHPSFDGKPESFCTNLFIDETAMEWEKKKRNLFVASDIVHMQPIINKDNTYFRFIEQNTWVFNFFPNFRVSFEVKRGNVKKQGYLLNWLEKIAYKSQLRYMKGKITSEILRKNIIHFNKNDNTSRILKGYNSIRKKYKIS